MTELQRYKLAYSILMAALTDFSVDSESFAGLAADVIYEREIDWTQHSDRHRKLFEKLAAGSTQLMKEPS